MPKVRSFKMPFANEKFNANQRVWIIYGTGGNAALCVGKFCGKGRFIQSWVNWSAHDKKEPQIQEFEVSAEFAERHGLV